MLDTPIWNVPIDVADAMRVIEPSTKQHLSMMSGRVSTSVISSAFSGLNTNLYTVFVKQLPSLPPII